MSFTNKSSLQAVVVEQEQLTQGKGVLKLALFNADGTPLATSGSNDSAKVTVAQVTGLKKIIADLTARVDALEKAAE